MTLARTSRTFCRLNSISYLLMVIMDFQLSSWTGVGKGENSGAAATSAYMTFWFRLWSRGDGLVRQIISKRLFRTMANSGSWIKCIVLLYWYDCDSQNGKGTDTLALAPSNRWTAAVACVTDPLSGI